MDPVANSLKKAQTYLSSGRADKAEKVCRKLLKDKKHYLAVRLLLAKALTQSKQLSKAADFMAEAATYDQTNDQLQSAAGSMLSRTGKHELALPFLIRSVSVNPQNSDMWLSLLTSWADVEFREKGESSEPQENSKQELIDLANKAIQIFPDDHRIMNRVGEILLAAELTSAALLCFEKVIEISPEFESAHQNWLQIQFSIQEYNKIIAHAERYQAFCLNNAVCQRCICIAYEQQGKFDDALFHISCALENTDLSVKLQANCHADRGRILGFLGRFSEALTELNIALDIDPNQPAVRQNRCLAYKCIGDVKGAAKDELARLEIKNKHAKFNFKAPFYDGSSINNKRLFVWADMGIGDTFKFSPLIRELPMDGHIILAAQGKMLPFLSQVLPNVELRPLPNRTLKQEGNHIRLFNPKNQVQGITEFDEIEEDFDFHMPLAALYTLLRSDIQSFKEKTQSLTLPPDLVQPFRDLSCLESNETTKVGIAWSSMNKNPLVDRNYMPLEDWLPILKMPGFEFYNFQYTTNEQEVAEFRETHDVPLYHAPGLDLMNDMLGTAAFNCCMDLFISPASTCSDIAGVMGIKSFRADLIHLPENFGQDHTPWYLDQKNLQIPWGKTIQDYLPDMQSWLLENKNHRTTFNQ